MIASTMPVGDLPGWTQLAVEDFDDDMPVGSFVSDSNAYLLPSCAAYARYYHRIRTYADATPDTSGNALYYPSKTLSVSGSCADIYLHSEIVNSKVRALGGSIHPSRPDGVYMQTYGRWAWRMRAANVTGRHYGCVATAINSRTWPASGEFCWPEGDVSRDIAGFYHHADPANVQWSVGGLGNAWADWHNYVVEWSPGLVNWFVDGAVALSTTDRVSKGPLGWLIQSGSTGGVPDQTTTGHIQIDWICTYDYAP